METKMRSKWAILIALGLVVLAANVLLHAACKKTTSKSMISYQPAGEECTDGKIKIVCTGTGCADAGSGEEGKECCKDSTKTTSCSKYVGKKPAYGSCRWDDAGIANGTTPDANLSGDDCTG